MSNPVECQSSQALHNKLDPGERILWTGQPPQGIVLRFTDVFPVPFSFVWMAFMAMWTVSAFRSPPPGPAQLVMYAFGLLMCLMGLYMFAGRFVYDYLRRKHTYYAVTSKRAMIAQAWPVERVQSFVHGRTKGITLDEGFGDVGTIRFPGGDETAFYLMGGNESWPWAGAVAPPRFERIHDARKVYDLIRNGGDEPKPLTRPA